MDKYKILMIVVISVVFGLAAGIVGEIVSRVYVMENAFGVPLNGEISVGSGNNSNLVIREAKKVVIEQNERLAEVAAGINNSAVGIYKKIELPSEDKSGIKPENYYRLDSAVGQGFIITSDGWLVTNYIPEKIKATIEKGVDKSELKKEAADNYTVITQDKKIYKIDQAVYDKESGYSFWHIPAAGLPVKRFTMKNELTNGQSVFAYNQKGWTWPTVILGSVDTNKNLVQSSDSCRNDMLLANAPAVEMAGSLLFDYNGGLIGILNSSNKISPIYNYLSVLSSLLKTKELVRPVFGVNYVDLSSLAGVSADNSKGALISKDKAGTAIIKGGSAEKAGLKEGDIILSIDSTELNNYNDLCDIIQQYKGGDMITVSYMRNKEKQEIKLTLGMK